MTLPFDCVPSLDRVEMDEMADWASERPIRHGWKGRTCRELWDSAPRGDWLLDYAEEAGADSRDLVRAAAACARPALRFVPAGEDLPRLAIEAAERWADEPTEEHRRSAENASADVAAMARARCGRIRPGSRAYAFCRAARASMILDASALTPTRWRQVPVSVWVAQSAMDAHLLAHGWDSEEGLAAQAAAGLECAEHVRRLVPFLDLAAPGAVHG